MTISRNDKRAYIRAFFDRHQIDCHDLHRADIDKIYELLISGSHRETENAYTCGYYALYYEITENQQLTERYYQKAIQRGNVRAILNFAMYHRDQGNISEMDRYYRMAMNGRIWETLNIPQDDVRRYMSPPPSNQSNL